MPYAIITVGGKQYRVQEGQTLLVDRVKGDEGATFEPPVLFVGGDGEAQLSPTSTVTARVVGHVLGEKIRIGKYKPKTGYKKHAGYRSRLSRIEIESIGGGAQALDGEGEPPRRSRPRPPPPRLRPPRRRDAPDGLRGPQGDRDRRLDEGPAPADARGGARVRAGARRAEGRDRRARGRDREADGGRLLMAHKKGLGSSRNGRDSNPKMLGVKIFDGQDVKAGMIIVRQRGTRFRPGAGTGIGRDDTIFATREGTVAFRTSGERRFVDVVD